MHTNKPGWISLTLLLSALPLALVISLLTAHPQDRVTVFYAPDQRYSLQLPADWKAEVRKDGLGREQVIIFSGAPEGATLEIRAVPATSLTSASAIAEHDEAMYVRFRTGYVKGKLVTLPAWKPNVDVALLEYSMIQDGQPIAGQNYYLRFDERQSYLLRFTGTLQVMQAVQPQVRALVESFRLSPPLSFTS
jgi:hypothetical protein